MSVSVAMRRHGRGCARSGAVVALLLAGPFLAGCDDPPDRPPVVVRDSLGIRILEVDPAQVGEWARFDPEPEWVLGDGVSAGGLVLRGVSDASFSEADEFVWIAERGSQALIGVDLTSDEVVRLGGVGDGPGDFRGLSRVWALGDGRVGAFDRERLRYVELGDGTTSVRSQSFRQIVEAGASPQLYRVPIRGEGARLYLALITGRTSEWVEGRHRGTGPLVLLHEPPDTLTWIPGTASFVAEGVAGAVMFGATTLLAEGGDGIWVGDAGKPEIALWQVGREPTRIVRWRAPPEAVTQELETRVRALIREAAPDDPLGYASIVPFADSLPFFEVLHADPEGAVWVTPYLVLPDSPWPEREWLVFDSEAGAAGWVTTPEAFRPLRVGRDYILGIHRDVLDVETVRLHRLRARSAVASARIREPDPAFNPHDLQEAALRWAFANAETNLDPPAAHCLAASPASLEEGQDPDPAFLARFTGDGVPVRPVSSCRLEDDPVNGVRDASTGEHALLFTISPVVPDDPERPTVEVGFLQGSLWGTGWRCAFMRNEHAWELEECVRILDV